MNRTVIAVSAVALLAGCATQPDQVASAYVSPLAYSSYNCNQLAQEYQRASANATAAYAKQRQQASNDTGATIVALFLFWPALFAIRGDGASEQELAQAKGSLAAIEDAVRSKRCTGIVPVA